MNYKGKPLEKLTKGELIDLNERQFEQLRMVSSTVPEDIKSNDIADWLPPDDEPWNPPHIAGILYRGVGKAGGK